MDAYLQHLVLERLGESELDEGALDLLLAAVEGPHALAAALSGKPAGRTIETVQPELEVSAPGAYLASIGVQGFRGIGPAAALELEPGPGLTLVVGRNGSGKSSFAEGLELLMTGANHRWEKRTQVWKQGWQNLHFDGDTELTAQLHVDGRRGRLGIRRRWEHGVKLAPAECEGIQPGWEEALVRYRPFLSYSELGAMFDEPKTMYEALAAILGLEDIDALQKSLRDARLERERAVKGVRAEVERLVQRLEVVGDDRVAVVVAALRAQPVDFAAIEHALEGSGEEGDPHHALAALRELATLRIPGEEAVDAAFARLHAAREAIGAMAGTDAARAASLVELLEVALRHDEAHGDEDCPVCGSEGAMDEQWRARTALEVGRLAAAAKAVESAQRDVQAAERAVRDLLAPEPPPVVAHARELALDPDPLERAWEQWTQARERVAEPEDEPVLRAALAGVEVAARELTAAAEGELERREDVWRPVAKLLGEWAPGARRALQAAARLDALKAAEAWARDAAADLQAQRLAPIADAARENWETLRQESNVTLDGFHLRKSGMSRSAEVDVRVDGSETSAFGVMSQGELHALAVSLFLPRAALPESPFRFMVIDDPVQSMDPSKVDGLARVLERAARGRQVIVFTHDERLPEAVRRLKIEATMLEVTRRPRSQVEVRRALDPVQRSIADARALLREERLPEEIARRVVPGFCRHALEAACITAVRRRRLGRGERHAEVEALFEEATRLNVFLSLALFDEPGRGGDVLAKVNNKWGARKGDVVVGCNKGVHEVLGGDLEVLVRESDVLARELAALP